MVCCINLNYCVNDSRVWISKYNDIILIQVWVSRDLCIRSMHTSSVHLPYPTFRQEKDEDPPHGRAIFEIFEMVSSVDNTFFLHFFITAGQGGFNRFFGHAKKSNLRTSPQEGGQNVVKFTFFFVLKARMRWCFDKFWT